MSSGQNRTTEQLAEDEGSPAPPDLGENNEETLIGSSEPVSLFPFGLSVASGGGGGGVADA